jgi:hypothetical protein
LQVNSSAGLHICAHWPKSPSRPATLELSSSGNRRRHGLPTYSHLLPMRHRAMPPSHIASPPLPKTHAPPTTTFLLPPSPLRPSPTLSEAAPISPLPCLDRSAIRAQVPAAVPHRRWPRSTAPPPSSATNENRDTVLFFHRALVVSSPPGYERPRGCRIGMGRQEALSRERKRSRRETKRRR